MESKQTGDSPKKQYQFPNIITAYGPKIKVPLIFPSDEGRTKQSFRDECDINVLMKRYEDTGTLEHITKRAALYANVTALDFQRAMDIVANARTAFADLPASVRDRFDNDPQKMLAFVMDDENAAEAEELGLLSPEGSARLAAANQANEAEGESVGEKTTTTKTT